MQPDILDPDDPHARLRDEPGKKGGSPLAATSAGAEIQLVTFFLNGEEYGVDAMRVREITGMAGITGIANSPRHVQGVMNLRGSMVPVVSLRRRFGMPDPVDGGPGCIAVMDFRDQLTGFVIDEISDVLRVKRCDIQPPLAMFARPWIEGVLITERKLVVFLNLEHLT
jgi:purine-binding chemotaxis protein CheW